MSLNSEEGSLITTYNFLVNLIDHLVCHIFKTKITVCVFYESIYASLRGCQLSKTNTCMIFTCIKKNDNFSKETGHS